MRDIERLIKTIKDAQEKLVFDVYRDIHKHDEHVELLHEIRDAVKELEGIVI